MQSDNYFRKQQKKRNFSKNTVFLISVFKTLLHSQHQQPRVIVGSADKIIVEALTKTQLVKEIFLVTKGFRWILALGAMSLFVGSAINIWVPKIQGSVIDAIIDRDMNDVKMKLILFGGLGFGRLCLSSLRMY